MSKTQTELKPIETDTRPPRAWYDLSARIINARAVASCIEESLPHGLVNMNDDQRAAINQVSGLAGALDDVLDLCERDMERLEQQLQGEKP